MQVMPASESERPNHAPWIQGELDAGRDVDTTNKLLLCRVTLYFRKGSGCLVGSGTVSSLGHPILHAAPDYERADELMRVHIQGIDAGSIEGFLMGRWSEPTDDSNDQ